MLIVHPSKNLPVILDLIDVACFLEIMPNDEKFWAFYMYDRIQKNHDDFIESFFGPFDITGQGKR